MVEEQRNRFIYGLTCVFIGVISLLILIFLLRVTVLNKVDLSANEVSRLFCTFKRLPFYVENVMSNATGKRFIRIQIMFESKSHQYYTLEDSYTFADVGWLYYNSETILAFSSERLEDGMDYVIDYGKMVYFDIYGPSSDVRRIVKIETIRQVEQFDNIISENIFVLSILMSFLTVITCSLFCLPFVEYYFHQKAKRKQEIEKRARALPSHLQKRILD